MNVNPGRLELALFVAALASAGAAFVLLLVADDATPALVLAVLGIAAIFGALGLQGARLRGGPS